MATVVIVIVVVVVLAALAVGGTMLARRRRTQQLQEQFGPEYDRVLEESDSRGEAESALSERKKRHDSLELTSLDESTREKYRSEWKEVQSSFVDDPGDALDRADGLINRIMRARGYPVDDFEQRAADISVDHPRVVENYREARRVHDAHRNGSAGTEDLRGAVTSYRNLVDALLDENHDEHGGSSHGSGHGEASSGTSGGDGSSDHQSTSGAGQADAAPGGGNRQ